MQKFPLMPSGNSDVARSQHVRPRALEQLNRLGPAVLLFALTAGMLPGCQCCRCTDHVSCLVDWTGDHAVPFDCVYCSKLDLTRINRPGGLQCCCSQCCPQLACCSAGVYAHRWGDTPTTLADEGLLEEPVYPAPQVGPSLENPLIPLREGPNDQAQPLFPMMPDEAPPRQSDPTESPEAVPPAEDGVIQMQYLRSGNWRQERRSPETPAPWLVPVDSLFGP